MARNGKNGKPASPQATPSGPEKVPAKNGAPIGRPRAELLAAADERRRRVWMLACVRKLTLAEIAQVVGIAKRTVDRDLAAVRKRTHDRLRQSGRLEEAVLDAAAEIKETTNAIARQAWADLVDAPKGSADRARFLRLALLALGEQVKLLQSLGIVKKVPEEVLIADAGIESQVRRLTSAQAREAMEFLDRMAADDPPGDSGPRGGPAGSPGLDREAPVAED